MKTFLEIHILQNFAPSNLNRDDTGAPKDALFGGFRRARISSQCIKNAVRQYFIRKVNKPDSNQSDNKLFNQNELAIRTKRILGELVSLLKKEGRNEAEAKEKIITVINSMGFSFKENGKTEYLIFLGKKEIEQLASLIHEKWDEIGDPIARLTIIKNSIQEKLYPETPDLEKMKTIFRTLEIDGDENKISDEKITAIENSFDEIIKILSPILSQIKQLPEVQDVKKPPKRKKNELEDWEKNIVEVLKEGKKGLSPIGKLFQKVMDGGKAADLALFGRMLADMPEKNQYASCQVAHAISTHSVTREFDFYTAIDQLKPEDNAGSDMMGTIEFNSACFYRYAVLDYEKLMENLQRDSELAIKTAESFINGFIISEPTGLQNSFAAHNPPEFISISVRKNTAPRNLSNAFEIPVRAKNEKSLTKESALKMSDKAASLDELYGSTSNSRYVHSKDIKFEEKEIPTGLGNKLNNVPALVQWAVDELTKGA